MRTEEITENYLYCQPDYKPPLQLQLLIAHVKYFQFLILSLCTKWCWFRDCHYCSSHLLYIMVYEQDIHFDRIMCKWPQDIFKINLDLKNKYFLVTMSQENHTIQKMEWPNLCQLPTSSPSQDFFLDPELEVQ